MSFKSTQQSMSKFIQLSSLILSCLLPLGLFAQVTPTEGTVECFSVGEGGIFVDFGGLGGDDDIEGAPGNYTNCDCVTTTTLCGVDNSAVTLEYTSMGVFAAFDWFVILDGDNQSNEVYPSSIMVDPDNVNLQLFNNADGVGDGGSENYGPGADNGVTDLAGMSTTTFTATNPNGCLTIVFRASGVVDDSGWEALISLADGGSHPGDNVECGASVTCPPPSALTADNIGPFSADLSWNASDSTDTYEIEYGPEGFMYGTGTMITVNGTTQNLTGLSSNTCYDVYIQAICDAGDVSQVVGPITFCTPVSCQPPSSLEIMDIQAEFATASWTASPSTDAYEIEYGPEGYEYGTGTSVAVNDTSFPMSGLQENTCYDVYLIGVCDVNDQSPVVGPVTFCTPFINPPDPCTYTVEMFDSFGDGWNGSFLDITVNGVTTPYTLDNINDDGSYAIYTFEVLDGLPLTIEYTAGAFQNEVTYNIYDNDNLVILSDGPNPQTGLVYEDIAICPDCPAINPNTVSVLDVGTNNIGIIWNPVVSAEGYIVEYGPSGFPQGFGLTVSTTQPFIDLIGLNPCVSYDFYIIVDCGADFGTSTAVGPFTETTLSDLDPGDPCTYTLNLFDSFGDGWNGSILSVTINGVTMTYTIPAGGDFATFTVNAFANQSVTVSYTAGAFQNEVTYDIIDPDGNVVFSDGPFPQVGVVYEFVACPSCAGPTNGTMIDVNATNAVVGWEAGPDAGNYTIEYGPLGFSLGTGNVVLGSDITQAELTGLLENTYYDVYVRFSCDGGDASKTLGPLTFKTLFLIDVGASGLVNPMVDACNLGVETVSFFIQNFGQSPQSLIPFFYAVNGAVQPVSFPTDGYFTGVVGNDSMEVASFDLQYDFSAPGYYFIQIWTELEDDSNLSNDTFEFELITALPLPLVEDFESGVFPDGWTTDEFNPVFAPNAHNNPTWVAGDNNWSFDTNFEMVTSRYGPLGMEDSLYFDYRFVDFFAGTIGTIIGGNILEVDISEDCGETWETIYVIDESNHVTSTDFETVYIELADYAGAAINVRWRTTWANGDFWTDIDNINITGCPNTLLISGDVTEASDPSSNDGTITVNTGFGTGPFTYDWDNGDMTQTITNLEPGIYAVTITDANGCTDASSFIVGAFVGATAFDLVQSISISPNPTAGDVLIDASLNTTEEIAIEVFNTVGQRIMTIVEQPADQIKTQIDLSTYPDGMYFIRLSSGGKTHIEKLILTASRP